MHMYLGIDYGRKHIGLAFAETSLATVLPSIKNDDNLISKLKNICKEHSITEIVLGLPTGPLSQEILNFKDNLMQELSLPVNLHDETLSTQTAISQLVASGASRKKRQNEHGFAAALILEDYLESATLY